MNDDAELLRRQRAFLFEVEQGIRVANREIIHERLPELNREMVLRLAVAVARLRATYLETALKLAGEPNSEAIAPLFEALAAHRLMFEEARSAFLALQRAIELGYVDLDESGSGMA